MVPRYDYTDILGRWETLPSIKIRYADDETGWAMQLSPHHACLANMSTSVELRLYDIVEIEKPDDEDDWPTVGDVLQTYYTQTLFIRYPAGATRQETTATFGAIRRLLQAVGGEAEGLCPGIALANVLPGCDIDALVMALQAQPSITAEIISYTEDEDER